MIVKTARVAPLTLVLGLLLPSTAPAARSAQEIRSDAVSWAVKQSGTREAGTSNCSRKIDGWVRAMGLRPCRPWCGAFVYQAFKRAGVRLSARLIDPGLSYRDAIAGRSKLRRISTSKVRRGDLLFFSFRPGPPASHLAIVRDRPRRGYVKTVEGNVSHAVALKTRGLRYAVLAARVIH